MKKKRPSKIRSGGGTFGPGFDPAVAGRIAHPIRNIRIDGRVVPVVEPVDPVVDHMEFDRRLSEAGVRRFVRERVESDFSPFAGLTDRDLAGASHILVESVARGVRTRRPLAIVKIHEMN